MARSWKPRQAPPPTSITEIARRYHAAAVALAQTLGLSVPEVLSAHRESVTAIFIECGRCDLRLPVGIKLAPLSAPSADATNGHTVVAQQDRPPVDPSTNGSVPEHGTGVPTPTTIPTDSGLPCGGQRIADLKPPALSMLISKTARLLQDQGGDWVPLLHALQAERAGRLDRGRKKNPPEPVREGLVSEGAADVPDHAPPAANGQGPAPDLAPDERLRWGTLSRRSMQVGLSATTWEALRQGDYAAAERVIVALEGPGQRRQPSRPDLDPVGHVEVEEG